MTSLEHDTQNDTRLSDFMSVVRELGRDAAMGKDALPNLAISFVRAVSDQVIDLAKDQNGDDGAARVFKAYAASEGKKAVHDRTETGLKANISKLRQLGNFASNPKWDAVDVLNKAHTIRQDAKRDDIDVKPAYAAFVDVAREQLKQDDELTDAQLFAAVTKTDNSREVTLEKELTAIHKKMEKLITGENSNQLKDQSPELIQAHELIGQRLAALMTAKQQAEDDAKLEEIYARRAAAAQPILQLAAE
jgi:hypothetical protein